VGVYFCSAVTLICGYTAQAKRPRKIC